MTSGIKLKQGQVWKHGEEYLRIVHLERLEVEYKAISDLATGKGVHHHVSKKDFCRLLKTATPLTPEMLTALRQKPNNPAGPIDTTCPPTDTPPSAGTLSPASDDGTDENATDASTDRQQAG